MSANQGDKSVTLAPPPGPYFVWVGRNGYRNGGRGWPTIEDAQRAARAYWPGRGSVRATLTVATFDGTVVWQVSMG